MQLPMPRDVTIITLLQEIKYLRQQIANTPELHYVGLVQWESTRPQVPTGRYTDLMPPD